MDKQIDNYLKYNKLAQSRELKSKPGASPYVKLKKGEGLELLNNAYSAWLSLEDMRTERRRNVLYRNGNQWSDKVKDPDNDGVYITEGELLTRQGKTLLKHNFIQQFIRNISGQMISNPSQSVVYARTDDDEQLGEMLTNALQYCHELNEVERMDLSFLEELIVSGIGCYKVKYDYWDDKQRGDGRIDFVSSNRLFFDSDLQDASLQSLTMVGEIHDYTLSEVVRCFASSPEEEKMINKIYSPQTTLDVRKYAEDSDFYTPADSSCCRVIELWHKRGRWETYVHDYLTGSITRDDSATERSVDKINKERLAACRARGHNEEEAPLQRLDRHYVYYWSVAFLSPNGDVLLERETPYSHLSHPYILASLPSADGLPKALISDVIDIQRYINRLIVMIDFIMGASAKGVLMVPENAVPDGYSINDFTSEYVKANGVILYKPTNTRDVPFQISSNSTNVGAWEMLNLQMNLIKEISGMSGAIQGHAAHSNTASSLYSQQAQNSQLNYKTLFETLRLAQKLRDEKLLKVLMQYYRTERYVSVAGKNFNELAAVYQPSLVGRIKEFNLVISRATDTPLYRQLNEEVLKGMLDRGQINMEMFLSNSTLPFADRLLSQIQELKNQQA